MRSWSIVPIIVISARSEDKSKIEALDTGADDYLTKPFSIDELLARLRATMRRLKYLEHQEIEDVVFTNGDLK
ncbi:response regulator, partial [Clostridioides difficile]